MNTEIDDHRRSVARHCYMACREVFRWCVIVPTVAIAAVSIPLLILAVTVIGSPIALLFFLGLCPFATIRWAFVRDESWWEAWKVCMRSMGD